MMRAFETTGGNKEDTALSVTIGIMLLSYLGTLILSAGFNRIGMRGSAVPALSVEALFFIAFIYCIPIIMKRVTTDTLAVPVLALVFVLAGYLLFPQNRGYIADNILVLFLNCIPAFLLARSIRDYGLLMKYLHMSSYILMCFCILYFLFYSMREGSRDYGYDMVFGYQACLAVIIIASKWIYGGGLADVLLSAAGIGIIVIKGSRGPLVCILVFAVLTVLFGKISARKRIALILALFAAGMLAYTFQAGIGRYVVPILDKYDIYSRSLSSLLADTITDPSDRDVVYSTVVANIKTNFLGGSGIFGDRAFLSGLGYSYSHNLVLEILADYGIPLGGLFLGGLLLLVIFGIRRASRNETHLIFISYAIVSCMFSGSYLAYFPFWIMLGLLMNNAFTGTDGMDRRIGAVKRALEKNVA